ncbi:MAG: prepilin peptidase [Nitrospirae bacterium]|nr:MAG: prepilin peptidase [Nitrospirota bacterium]
MELALSVLVTSVVLCAAVTDWRWHKIPNILTFPAMLTGVIGHTLMHGASGFLFSAEGLFLGIGLLLGFYMLGGMAAGDVKLLGAVGAFLGPMDVFLVFLMTALLGGVYAIGMMIHHAGIKGTFCWIGLIGKTLLLTGKVRVAFADSSSSSQPKLRYGLVIALGTLTYKAWYWLGIA